VSSKGLTGATSIDVPQDGDWVPNPGPQTQFLKSTAYEVLFGGAAGGSKSESLLVAPLRWVDNRHFRAILFRRTFPDLEKSLIDRSRQLYPRAFPGASYSGQTKSWTFPSGAVIYFGYCEHDNDVYQYQSAEFSFIGFDELTHFSERQYTYLLSRARSSKGLPVRIRSATNPGGVGSEWVFKRWAAWLDTSDSYKGVRAQPGQTLWYVNEDGERYCSPGTPEALSRVFIPSKVTDNPHLMMNDPAYISRLKGLDPVTRAQLLDGNWLIKPARGLYFKRSKLTLVEESPVKASRIRYWDRASTGETEIAKRKRSDPDYTVGLRLAKTSDGLYFVEDVVRFRGSPFEVQDTILQTAKLDGKSVQVGIEQDPGQAGEAESLGYVRMLDGFNVRRYPARQDKVTRAQPASAQWEAGNFRVLNRPWSQSLVQELEAFPEGGHDDQVDALSGAHMALSKPITEKVDGGVVHRPQVFDNDSGW